MFILFTSHAKGHLYPALSLAQHLVSLPASSARRTKSLHADDYFGAGLCGRGLVVTPRPLTGVAPITGIQFCYLSEDPTVPLDNWEAMKYLYDHEDELVQRAKEIVREQSSLLELEQSTEQEKSTLQSASLKSETSPVLIYDMLSCWVVRVGQDLDLPNIMFSPSPLYFMWIVSHSAQFMERFGYKYGQKIEDEEYIDLPGARTPISLKDLPEKGAETVYFDRHLERWHDADCLIVNDHKSIYKEPSTLIDIISDSIGRHGSENWRVVGNRVRLVGLLGTRATSLMLDQKDPVIQWLNIQKPQSILFVALGSWCDMSAENLRELALGLIGTRKRFLWAFRPSRCVGDGTEDDGLPKGFRALATGAGNRIEDWVDQKQVLQHPAIALFISHCGWNSLTEAISLCGKPIVGIPLGAEQGMNAHYIHHELHIGVRLRKMDEPLDAKTTSDTILRVLADPELTRNAAKLQQDVLAPPHF